MSKSNKTVFKIYGSVWGKYLIQRESLAGGSVKYRWECLNSNGEQILKPVTQPKYSTEFIFNDPMSALNDMIQQAKKNDYELIVKYIGN